MDFTEITTIASIIIAVVSMIVAWTRERKGAIEKLEHRLTALEEKALTTEKYAELEHRLTALEEDAVTKGRLTVLEQNMMSKEERKILNDIQTKMDMLWKVIEKDLPKLLKQRKTPALDKLLEKAEKGLDNLSFEEMEKLDAAIDKQKKNLEENPRKLALVLYSTFIKYYIQNGKS